MTKPDGRSQHDVAERSKNLAWKVGAGLVLAFLIWMGPRVFYGAIDDGVQDRWDDLTATNGDLLVKSHEMRAKIASQLERARELVAELESSWNEIETVDGESPDGESLVSRLSRTATFRRLVDQSVRNSEAATREALKEIGELRAVTKVRPFRDVITSKEYGASNGKHLSECDDGWLLVGGGCAVKNGTVTMSYPMQSGRGWECRYSRGFVSETATATAICVQLTTLDPSRRLEGTR